MKDDKLIMFGLIPLIVLSFLSIILGHQFIGIDVSRVSIARGGDKFNTQVFYFNLDPLTIGLEILIAIAVACAIIGIRVIGTGLSEQSVRILTVGICYSALWTFLSLLAYTLIREIEIFGITLYLLLTIIYSLGVITKMVGE